MARFVFRKLQEGRQGKPAITREQKHFSEIHESHCKPLSCLACSYLNQLAKVSIDLCSAIDRTTERTNDKASTVTLVRAPRVNNQIVRVLFTVNTKPFNTWCTFQSNTVKVKPRCRAASIFTSNHLARIWSTRYAVDFFIFIVNSLRNRLENMSQKFRQQILGEE